MGGQVNFDAVDWVDSLLGHPLAVRKAAAALLGLADRDGRIEVAGAYLRKVVAKDAGLSTTEFMDAVYVLRSGHYFEQVKRSEGNGSRSVYVLRNPNGPITTTRHGSRRLGKE